MKHVYRRLTGLLLLASGSAAAQAQATGPLQPVQSIALAPNSALGGTVQLANRSMVLLLTDTDSPNIRVQCLSADGQTAWQTNLDRYQRTKPDYSFSVYNIFNPLGGVAIGQNAKQEKLHEEQRLGSMLLPVNVFTYNNQVLAVEKISADALKKQPKGSTLKENQVYVQRLDEKGQLTKVLFEPRPEPESRKTEDVVLGRYADADGYVEVVRETNKREETLNFFVNHYDLKTKAVRREPLELPATPEHVGNFNSFRHWYQEWAYLGHRPNQTYFCRRTLVNGPKDKAGKQPLTYQVYIADDRGARAPGGFSTTLELNKNTTPLYSGTIPESGELAHIPNYYTQQAGKNNYVTYDEWDTSTGGVGSFYLDHATGDVIIFGEYGEGDVPYVDYKYDLDGYFQRRYTFDGQTRNKVQAEYTKAMRDDKRKASFTGSMMRNCRFHLDPLNNQSQYSFSSFRYYGKGEDFDLYLDENLKMQRYDYLAAKKTDDRIFTHVVYAEPFWLYKPTGTYNESRVYEHATKADLPVYAALEKMRRAAGSKATDYQFHLGATGPGQGLVVEKKQNVGGNLQVYRF
jgi:hypothetical protein